MGVFFAEETLELGGIAAEHLRDFFGIESYEAFCEVIARFIVDPHRVSGGEIAPHFEYAGGKQAGGPSAYRIGSAGIGHERALRVCCEPDP